MSQHAKTHQAGSFYSNPSFQSPEHRKLGRKPKIRLDLSCFRSIEKLGKLKASLTDGAPKLRVLETLERFLARSLDSVCSDESARSWASSSSLVTFLYLDRLMAATSSCKEQVM